MSTAADSVMEFTRHPQSSSVNCPYLSDETDGAHVSTHGISVPRTIVGRRGSLRSILSQVEAVAGTNTTF